MAQSSDDRLRREHADRIKKLQADHDAKMAALRQQHDEAKEQWVLKERLRREEEGLRRKLDDEALLEIKRQGRDYRRHIGLEPTAAQRCEHLADVLESDAVFANEPDVVRLRDWIHATCRRESIELREDALPQLQNGTAIRGLRRAVIAPIQSFETAAVAAHEIGHILSPAPTGKRVKTATGEVGVSAEILAWEWVHSNVPVWNAVMHRRMCECLDSYRQYAEVGELQRIDALCAPQTMRLVKAMAYGRGR